MTVAKLVTWGGGDDQDVICKDSLLQNYNQYYDSDAQKLVPSWHCYKLNGEKTQVNLNKKKFKKIKCFSSKSWAANIKSIFEEYSYIAQSVRAQDYANGISAEGLDHSQKGYAGYWH